MFRYVVGYLDFNDGLDILLKVVHAQSPEEAVIAYLQAAAEEWINGFVRRHPLAVRPEADNWAEILKGMDMAAIDNECFKRDFTVNALCLGEVHDA